MIHRLAVLGVGLLGGSVARAARARQVAGEIVGVGRDAGRLAGALRDGTLDGATTDLAQGVAGADLVVLGATVAANQALLERVWASVADGAIVTDVGSTKRSIVRAAERLAATRPLAFVGSHPMAGSERSGYAASRADLFDGALVIVTPTDATEPRAVKGITAFWEALGARVTALDPVTHDRGVAAISHLPNLVAHALMAAVARDGAEALPLAASGFRDTTRIAASDPRMWTDIFLDNRDVLLPRIAEFRRALDDLEALIRAGDRAAIEAVLARIKAAREGLA
ncbi:MAG: prephenate dehydrogenase [Candidatus Rokuibacteriota bacterium]